jgi:hypothetical protein
MTSVAGTSSSPEQPGGGADSAAARTRRRLAGWSVAIAMTGIPATVAVQVLGQGAAATAGATAIGTITVTAFGAAKAFMRERDDAVKSSRPRQGNRRNKRG